MTEYKALTQEGKITLYDGRGNTLYDLVTGETTSITLSQHAMRFHLYDKKTNTATQHYYNTDPAFYTKLRGVLMSTSGLLYRTSSWITISAKPYELWPSEQYAEMALRDLEDGYGWKSVEITGCSIRHIRYTSDGSIATTPDAIGKYGGYPLVYRGRAVGVIFKINGQDVLYDSANVVYALPKPWWIGFHTKYRKVPKDFPTPGRLGFVCTNWCQRHGHSGYSEGIYIASMTQNHSVGSWAATQLRAWWSARGGIKDDEYFILKSSGSNAMNSKTSMAIATLAIAVKMASSDLGVIGTVCKECGTQLPNPFPHTCYMCGASNDAYTIMKFGKAPGSICSVCGRVIGKGYGDSKLCSCDPPGRIVFNGQNVDTHLGLISSKLQEVKSLWAKKML